MTKKPTMAGTVEDAAWTPSNGGRMRFPAPKNMEKSVAPTSTVPRIPRRDGAADASNASISPSIMAPP